eukprot:gene34995-42381_t
MQYPQFTVKDVEFSTLNGKALTPNQYPTLAELRDSLPPGTFKKDTWQSLKFAATDAVGTGLSMFLGIKYLLPLAASLLHSSSPLANIGAVAIWIFYSIFVGTFGIGAWVTAHECGHGAFSDNKKLTDFVGYTFHSLMLVPYFSWQRSHAVHHANTNHAVDGETHVPPIAEEGSSSGKKLLQGLLGNKLGEGVFGTFQIFAHLIIGWPAYLLLGATGGPSRGITNHFVPWQLPRPDQAAPLKELFPGAWKAKVLLSDIGVLGTVAGLVALSQQFGAFNVLAAYGGPLLVVNAWLVLYTWLQHTDVDIPHLPAEGYSFMKGAFHTVDRPYNRMLWGVIDYLHHHIGSTHVVHHIDSTIPHYRAKAATEAVKAKYPALYLYEDTDIFQALWRVATKCFAVQKRKNIANEDIYVFVDN